MVHRQRSAMEDKLVSDDDDLPASGDELPVSANAELSVSAHDDDDAHQLRLVLRPP